MINKTISKCPVCDEDLAITRMYCVNCNTTIEGHFAAEHTPFGKLSPEQMQFLLTFVKCEGRLNRMEDEMKLSYPTLEAGSLKLFAHLGMNPAKKKHLSNFLRKNAGPSLKNWITARSPGMKPRRVCGVKKSRDPYRRGGEVMASNEERMKVLKMVQEGKITPEMACRTS